MLTRAALRRKGIDLRNDMKGSFVLVTCRSAIYLASARGRCGGTTVI
jgi:hypothetical protein